MRLGTAPSTALARSDEISVCNVCRTIGGSIGGHSSYPDDAPEELALPVIEALACSDVSLDGMAWVKRFELFSDNPGGAAFGLRGQPAFCRVSRPPFGLVT
jgi:hypothetical protein